MPADRVVDVRASFVAKDEPEPETEEEASQDAGQDAGQDDATPRTSSGRRNHWLGGKVANPMTKLSGEDVPDKGLLTVGDSPGFGLTLDPGVRLVPAVPGTAR